MTNWILKILWIIPLLLFYSCSEESPAENKHPQIISNTDTVNQDDSTQSNSTQQEELSHSEIKESTQKYFYPNMSHCGGALYGIYKYNELVRIESTYGAEMGFSSKNIDFESGEVVRINYREHFAEWSKYSEKYPNDDEIDPKKMTYSDTLYVLEFGKKRSFKKYAGKKLIASTINKEVVDRLIKCVDTMKSELASEKQLVKN